MFQKTSTLSYRQWENILDGGYWYAKAYMVGMCSVRTGPEQGTLGFSFQQGIVTVGAMIRFMGCIELGWQKSTGMEQMWRWGEEAAGCVDHQDSRLWSGDGS